MNLTYEFHNKKNKLVMQGLEPDKIFVSKNLLNEFVKTHAFHETRTTKDGPNTLFGMPFFRVTEDNIFEITPKL